jgi:hypothetical protein
VGIARQPRPSPQPETSGVLAVLALAYKCGHLSGDRLLEVLDRPDTTREGTKK